MHISVSACASRKQPLNTSGTEKGTNPPRLLSWVHKWCFSALRYSYHIISVCQVTGEVKNITADKWMFWVGMKEDVENQVSSWLLPGVESTTQETLKVPLGKMPLPAQLWCVVQVALKESLPETPVNNKDLLMFHNYFPKHVIATPVPDTRNFGKHWIHMIPVKPLVCLHLQRPR